MTLELLIPFLIMLALLNWVRFRDLLYPGFIQATLWLCVVTLVYFYRYQLIEISSTTWVLILVGASAFSFGVLLTTLQHRPWMKPTLPQLNTLPSRQIMNRLGLLPLAGLAIMAWKARQLSHFGHLPSRYLDYMEANLKSSLTTRGVENFRDIYGPVIYLFAPAVVVTSVYLFRFLSSKATKEFVWLAGACFVATCYIVLFTARTLFLLFLLTLCFIVLVLRRASPLRLVPAAMGCFAVIFFVGGILMFKGGRIDFSLSENLSSMYRYVLSYTVAPVAALDQMLHSSLGPGQFQSLRFFYAVARGVGVRVDVPSLFHEFTYVPFPVNVYTFYSPYYEDFGYIAAVLAQFVVGLWHGWLYRRATVRRPKAGYVFLYSVFMFPLFLQFFDELYIRALSTWIQYVAWAGLFFWVLGGRKVRPPAVGRVAPLEVGDVRPLGPRVAPPNPSARRGRPI